MHVIRHATRSVTFAARVAGDRREVGVEFGPRAGVDQRTAFLRAENDVNDDETQRLWHGGEFRANGPVDTSVGHRPTSPEQRINERQRRGSTVRHRS